MSQDMLGADVGGLQEIARDCEKAAKTADTIRMILQAIVAAARMFGPWSEAFIAYLANVVIPWLAKVAQALRMFAKVLNAHANAQMRVSNGEDVNFRDLPQYVSPIAPIGDTPPGSAPPSDPAEEDSTVDDDDPAAVTPAPAPAAPAPAPAAPAPATGGGSGGGGGWPSSAMRPLPEVPELDPLGDLEEEEEEQPEEVNQEMTPIVVQMPQVAAPGIGLGAMLGGLAAAAAGGGLLGAAVTYGVQKKMAKQDADDGSTVLGRASFDQPRRP